MTELPPPESLQRCATVGFLGIPNSGKSTLTNALVGHKIAAVSRRAQTTRNPIRGIVTENQTQLVFVDTPGLHDPRRLSRLNAQMTQAAWASSSELDVICFLIACGSPFDAGERRFLAQAWERHNGKFLVLCSQADRYRQPQVARQVARIRSEVSSHGILPEQVMALSAKRPTDLRTLRDTLGLLAPTAPWAFAAEQTSDVSATFLCAELIREQVFRQTGDEIPYGVGVRTESITEDGNLTRIDAVLVVSRPSHKAILIGRRGERLGQIGAAARASLEQVWGKRIHLALWVRVSRDWVNDPHAIEQLQGLGSSSSLEI